MSLPETCPFCGCFGELKSADRWVGFTCMTTIHAGQDARRMQSLTCAGLERKRLDVRLAAMEAEVKQAREDEAWAHSCHVGCIARGEDGWMASRWNAKMRCMDQVNAPTIHATLRALRAKVEGGAR